MTEEKHNVNALSVAACQYCLLKPSGFPVSLVTGPLPQAVLTRDALAETISLRVSSCDLVERSSTSFLKIYYYHFREQTWRKNMKCALSKIVKGQGMSF